MAKFIRYTLAAVCFATSVGCLALWGWSIANQDQFLAARLHLTKGSVVFQVHRGRTVTAFTQRRVLLSKPGYQSLPPIGGSSLFGNTPINNQNLSVLTQPLRQRRGDFWYLVEHLDTHPLILMLGEEQAGQSKNSTSSRSFGQYRYRWFWFPAWYPALIFALAGVAVLRFGRQFSIRSALVTTTVLAALIAMAVTL